MTPTETTTIRLPYSPEALEFAERYCSFYIGAKFTATADEVIVKHTIEIDPTNSIFWPGT